MEQNCFKGDYKVLLLAEFGAGARGRGYLLKP